jgi:formylglycine-generating enzyme required for sulfatase activity
MLAASLCLSSCSKRNQAPPTNRTDRSSKTPATRPADKPEKPRIPSLIALDLGGEVKMMLVLIPAGKFLMGGEASAAETARKFQEYGSQESYYVGEHPQREVNISKPFYMGRWEVTRPQWRAVMGSEPWKGKKCDRPGAGDIANHVSWDDANKFCLAISKKTGRKFALPTEAQWEYACRAGSKSAFSFGDDELKLGLYAWYAANALGVNEPHPHSAGQKHPNILGLYDMHGNAAEWCRDWYAEKFYQTAGDTDPENTEKTEHRVLRGGQWDLYPDACRSAYRFKDAPAARRCGYGFRVVIAVEPSVDLQND